MLIIGAGVACIAFALVLAFSKPPPNEHAGRDSRAEPRRLVLSTVDIGSFRYFDLRTFPRDALVGFAHVDAAKKAIAENEGTPAAYVWVMPACFASMLEECEGFAKHLLLTRLRDPVRKPTPVFVYVDGWTPDTSHDVIAREAGVELILELPKRVGSDGVIDERKLLDEAAERHAAR